jgi:hypothetical protein
MDAGRDVLLIVEERAVVTAVVAQRGKVNGSSR